MGSNNSWFLHNELMIMPGSYITRSSLPFRYNFDICMSFRNHRIWLYWLFPKLKRPLWGTRVDWGDKSQIEEGADGYSGKGLFGMFRGVEKTLT